MSDDDKRPRSQVEGKSGGEESSRALGLKGIGLGVVFLVVWFLLYQFAYLNVVYLLGGGILGVLGGLFLVVTHKSTE